MKMIRLLNDSLIVGGLLLAMAVCAIPAAEAAPTETESAAVDAYIYGYSLVTMELTRRNFTNVVKPDGKSRPWATSSMCRNIPPHPTSV